MSKLDRYRGCLIGGAAGDALGYPVEFQTDSEIRAQYGPGGIVEYHLSEGWALISDDTQMTLFTANGLLYAKTRGILRGIAAPYPVYIAACYRDWLETQQKAFPLEGGFHASWLVNVPELFHRRAPGATCLTAIASGREGTIQHPINQSKGCGGIMRVAPIGLYLDRPGAAGHLAAETAALTHGHELGWLPAGVLAYCISVLAHGDDISLLAAIQKAMVWAERTFSCSKYLETLTTLIDRAVSLAQGDAEDREAISALGEGWVAEETLAIAVYCVLRHSPDFDSALIAAVNHSGDSDSTGAVTGNLLGASLGLEKIPAKYLEHLELKDVVLELADDLYADCKARQTVTSAQENGHTVIRLDDACDPVWEAKYVTAIYGPGRTPPAASASPQEG